MFGRPKSDTPIQTRLVATTTLVLAAFLALTGLVLDQSFQASTLTRAEEQLRLVIYSLMGVAETEGGQLVFRELPDPRLLQPESGLYAAVAEQDGDYRWRSPSALTTAVEFPRVDALFGEFHFSANAAPERYLLTYAVIWEDVDEPTLIFQVATDQAPFTAAIRSFRQSLYLGLGIVTLLVIGAQILAIRWGLKPLRGLAGQVRELEEGKRDALSGGYPKELQGLADNLGRFVVHEQRSRARYRNALDDLAHSLKTPLAVMRNALSESLQAEGTRVFRKPHGSPNPSPRPANAGDHQSNAAMSEADGDIPIQHPGRSALTNSTLERTPTDSRSRSAELLAEQLDRMENAVSRQLSRATVTGPLVVAKPVDLSDVLRRLGNALQTAHRDRAISLELNLAERLSVLGDQRDFMDLFGNILENAFKYTRRRVLVTATADARTRVCIEDDGPGIDPDIRSQVIHRGTRADHAQPGQGIGLAVVAELATLYGGHLEIATSRFGGASVTVTL